MVRQTVRQTVRQMVRQFFSASGPRRQALLAVAVSLVGHVVFAALAMLARPLEGQASPQPVEVQLVERLAPLPDPPLEQPGRASVPAPVVAGRHAKPSSRARTPTPSPPSANPAQPPPLQASSETGAVAVSVAQVTPAFKAVTQLSPAPHAAVQLPLGKAGTVAVPRYRQNPAPEYPAAARRRREEGEVRLDVTVGRDGRPQRVSLMRSSGHPLLDEAAVSAVQRWTFEPARAAGQPVEDRVVVPVRFSLAHD